LLKNPKPTFAIFQRPHRAGSGSQAGQNFKFQISKLIPKIQNPSDVDGHVDVKVEEVEVVEVFNPTPIKTMHPIINVDLIYVDIDTTTTSSSSSITDTPTPTPTNRKRKNVFCQDRNSTQLQLKLKKETHTDTNTNSNTYIDTGTHTNSCEGVIDLTFC